MSSRKSIHSPSNVPFVDFRVSLEELHALFPQLTEGELEEAYRDINGVGRGYMWGGSGDPDSNTSDPDKNTLDRSKYSKK
jgi:hypothetical protein